MGTTDEFAGRFGDVGVKLDEQKFCRSVTTTLAHQLVTNVDDEVLADLFSICRSDLTIFGIADKARMSRFQQTWRKRKQLLARLSSLTDQLRVAIDTANPDILLELDKRRLNAPVRKLFDVIEDTADRWRASQSMAETARRQPYPGLLSLSLNDFLIRYHHRRWNQQTRDLIIAACLQVCRAYPRKHTFARIVGRVPMQRSRAARAAAGDEGRVVHQPRAARTRK